MRMMLQLQIDTESGNRAVAAGNLGRVMEELFARVQPEAAYFTTIEGERGGFVVFDLDDPSVIPALAEPLFTELGAKVTLAPVMDRTDLQKGLTSLMG